MAQLTAALVREQNVTFAVAIMKDNVLNSTRTSTQQIQAVGKFLGCPLVVLMGEKNKKLRGNRQDLVKFVANIDPSRLPWKTWRL